jgi:hypothetical protein
MRPPTERLQATQRPNLERIAELYYRFSVGDH